MKYERALRQWAARRECVPTQCIKRISATLAGEDRSWSEFTLEYAGIIKVEYTVETATGTDHLESYESEDLPTFLQELIDAVVV